jgi:cell division protein FtsL
MIAEEILIGTALLFVVAFIGLVWFLQKQAKKLRTKVEALTLLVKDGDKQREAVKRELQELRSGTIGVGRRVLELEKKLQQQDAKLDEANQQDPQARLYSRAMKMVDLGAGIDELIQECELPKAEAELLIRLHRKD